MPSQTNSPTKLIKPLYRGGIAVTTLLPNVRKLRQGATKAENALWALLRNRKHLGLKWRRQQQIGIYIADFYCQEKKLVIEVDGGIHSTLEQQQKDQVKDAHFKFIGMRVLRLKNSEVLENQVSALAKIAAACEAG